MAAKAEPGKGKAYPADKKSEKHPDMKGYIITDQDYPKGSEIKMSFWLYKNPNGPSLGININNWKPDGQRQQWPRPVKDDEEVPF
jgi:hypothetical protein